MNATASASSPLAHFFTDQAVLVLDGALATELEKRGADLNDPLWSARLLIEQPALIRQLHLDYFRAGADVATTASYQASFEGFARRGLDAAAAAELMRTSVRLATEARDSFWAEPAHRVGRRRPLVAASVGPYGAMLADGSEYRGHYTLDEDALMTFHRPRLKVLADAGADLLACETLPCLAEARALARLLAEEFPDTLAWISFSCRDGLHNSQGERLADCAEALDTCPQVLAIGLNCTAPQHVDSLISEVDRPQQQAGGGVPQLGRTVRRAEQALARLRPRRSLCRAGCRMGPQRRQAHRWLLPHLSCRHPGPARAPGTGQLPKRRPLTTKDSR